MHQLAEVLVALIEIFIIEVEFELVALVVGADDGGEDLRLTDEVLTHQLHSEFRVQVVF